MYTDEFVLKELETATQATSYLFGLVYEAQNNWWAAKANYQLALESASDGTYSELKKRLDRTTEMAEKYSENFLFGHLEHSDVSSIRLSFNGKIAASFQISSRVIIWNMSQQKILKEIEDKNALCMDANSTLDRIVLGLRSGLIVFF